jgi:hypothetical protein
MHFQMWMIPIGYVFIGFLAMARMSWVIGKHIAKAHRGDTKSPCTDNEGGCEYHCRHQLAWIAFLFWPVFVAYIPFCLWSTFWRNAGMNSNLPPLNSHPVKTESDADNLRPTLNGGIQGKAGPQGVPGYQGSDPGSLVRGYHGSDPGSLVGGWQATCCCYCGAQKR